MIKPHQLAAACQIHEEISSTSTTSHFNLFFWSLSLLIGLAYQEGKDIVFRFIIEYSSSLRDFGAYVIIGLFSYEDFWKLIILACFETWD
jgi:predicted LPLAT superfamily acyltransferase